MGQSQCFLHDAATWAGSPAGTGANLVAPCLHHPPPACVCAPRETEPLFPLQARSLSPFTALSACSQPSSARFVPPPPPALCRHQRPVRGLPSVLLRRGRDAIRLAGKSSLRPQRKKAVKPALGGETSPRNCSRNRFHRRRFLSKLPHILLTAGISITRKAVCNRAKIFLPFILSRGRNTASESTKTRRLCATKLLPSRRHST